MTVSLSAVLSVDISRPVKLTLTAQLIRKLSEFGDAILNAAKRDRGVSGPELHVTPDEQSGEMAQQSTAQHTYTRLQDSKNSNSTQNGGSTEAAKSLGHGSVSGSSEPVASTQVKVGTKQVVMEFQLSSRMLDTSAISERESFVSLEGEMSLQERPVSVAEDGLVLVWDHLTLAFPNVSSTGEVYYPRLITCFCPQCLASFISLPFYLSLSLSLPSESTRPTAITGDLTISGVQFLSIMECSSSPIILPAQLNCFLLQHLPASTLDLYVRQEISPPLHTWRETLYVYVDADRIQLSIYLVDFWR